MIASAIEKECSGNMVKAVEFLRQELHGVRTGQAHAGLVEHLKIEVSSYGSMMQLRELATIAVPEPSTLLIKPFDPQTLKDIERGLQASSLGIAPVNDGKTIRLPIPPLSGERRQQLVHEVKKMAEAQKIAVRNARRDANKAADTAEKKTKTLSEDQAADLKGTIQKLTKKHENDIDSIISAKIKEIEEV